MKSDRLLAIVVVVSGVAGAPIYALAGTNSVVCYIAGIIAGALCVSLIRRV